MRAGRLRHPVTIYRTAVTYDDAGAETVAHNEVEDAWVSIEPLRGDEALAAMQLDATVTHRVMKRHGETITPDCWFSHDGRTFNVKSVRNIRERDQMDELLCGEDVDD